MTLGALLVSCWVLRKDLDTVLPLDPALETTLRVSYGSETIDSFTSLN